MRTRSSVLLAAAAAVAIGTVLLTRAAPAAGATFALLCTLAHRCVPGGVAGLAALPALLAALTTAPPSAPDPPVGPVRIRGTVVAARRDPLTGDADLQLATSGGRLRLELVGPTDIHAGDCVTATARCSPPAIPGGVALLQAAGDAIAVERGPASLPRSCELLREALAAQLAALVPGSAGALVITLVLGTGVRLPADLAAAHRATGLSHLLAVSGAHAAMLAWILGLQPFGPGRRRRIGALHHACGLTALAAYGAITGMEPPVFRALCSYLLVALGLRTCRRVGLVAGLAWPAMLSCLWAPDRVLGASFCLSYAAVVGLWLAGTPRSPAFLERWLAAPLRASLWATVATAPLTLAFFGQLAPWTVLLTPLLAPLVALLLFLGLGASLLALLLPAAGAVLALPLRPLADSYHALVVAADRLPLTPVHGLVTPAPWLLAAGFAGALGVLLLGRSRPCVLLAAAAACLPHFVPWSARTAPQLWLLAVGHGQACLVTQADGSNVLVDCGSLQHPRLPARKVEQRLRWRRIDLLVLTHGDHDHVGAVPDLLDRLPVRAAALPETMRGSATAQRLREHGTALSWVAAGQRLEPRPGIVLGAPPRQGNDNDDSLWVAIDLDGMRVLLPGDAGEAGVDAALAAGLASAADVLVLPHHGRDNAAIGRLLDAVRPRLCLCSNRHGEGHSPQGELTLARGVQVFATGIAGDLQLLGGGAPVLVADGFALPPPRTAAAR